MVWLRLTVEPVDQFVKQLESPPGSYLEGCGACIAESNEVARVELVGNVSRLDASSQRIGRTPR